MLFSNYHNIIFIADCPYEFANCIVVYGEKFTIKSKIDKIQEKIDSVGRKINRSVLNISKAAEK